MSCLRAMLTIKDLVLTGQDHAELYPNHFKIRLKSIRSLKSKQNKGRLKDGTVPFRDTPTLRFPTFLSPILQYLPSASSTASM